MASMKILNSININELKNYYYSVSNDIKKNLFLSEKYKDCILIITRVKKMTASISIDVST